VPRRKRFDLCQKHLCMRKTMTGEKERDPAKRWCSIHYPPVVAICVARLRKAPRKKCSAMRAFREANRWCATSSGPRRQTKPRAPRLLNRPRCATLAVKCVDPWYAWKRFRCVWPRKVVRFGRKQVYADAEQQVQP
jgi:hypothetical protein